MTGQEIKDQFYKAKADRLSLPPSYLIKDAAREYMDQAVSERQFYNGTWMGLPIIQFPDDLMALQEIIWATKPDIIIETGLAHGGSAVFYGSMLAMVGKPTKWVISIENGPMPGISQEIRNKLRPMGVDHSVFRCSSTDDMEIWRDIPKGSKVMVCLDSYHTAEHVREEIRLLGPLVTPGCYLVVFDTFVANRPADLYEGKPWSPTNSPMSAVRGGIPGFKHDTDIDRRYLISSNPNGYFVKE